MFDFFNKFGLRKLTVVLFDNIKDFISVTSPLGFFRLPDLGELRHHIGRISRREGEGSGHLIDGIEELQGTTRDEVVRV